MGSIGLRQCRRAAALWFLLGIEVALAQEANRPPVTPPSETAGEQPTPAPAPPAAGPIREEEPAVFLLPDGKGEYKPVINFPLEKFKQLLEMERQLSGGIGKPSAAVEMRAQAVADGGRARLEFEFQFTLPGEGWTRVPLGLNESVVVSHEALGPGRQVLLPAEDGPGYVVWIEGRSGDPARLRLSALAPIQRVGGESRLHLTLPRLTTSELTLRVPLRDAVVRTPQGTILEQVPNGNGDQTVVRSVGASGTVDLSWREAPKEAAVTPSALAATGLIQAQLDGQAATITAALTVTAKEGVVERFQVQLPAGATLISAEAAGYTVTSQGGPANAADDAPRAQLVEVRPMDAPSKQVELKLVVEQLLPPPGTIDHVDLAGFELIGARQQTGFLALRVVGDWQIVFGERRNVREVAPGDVPASLRSSDLVSGFEYLAQPSLLMARVVPRRPRVAVEPVYIYRVTADAIELDARFRYTIRGARVFALDVEFPNDSWTIEELGPAGLVDHDGVLFEQLQPLSVPLLQPGSGELELRCRATRPLPADQALVAFDLPRPLANSVGPARVIVLSADNVELVPRTDELRALGRQSGAEVTDLPPQQQEPLVYRGDVGKARFAAERRVLKQNVTADMTTQIDLRQPRGSVTELLRIKVRYEPLERIALRVPATLLEDRGLEVQLDGQRVPWTPDRILENSPAAQLVYIALSKPLLGSAEVRIRYALPEHKLAPRVSVPLNVPLVAPAGATSVSGEAVVVTRPGLEVHSRGEAWQPADPRLDAADADEQLRFTIDAPATELALALNLADPEAFGATVIERAWFQTWLGERNRQDRAVLQVDSRQPALRFSLPVAVSAASIDVRVDGQRVAALPSTGGSFVVPLAAHADRDRHTVELAYGIPRGDGWNLRLQAPQFGEDVRLGNTYWQVVLPKDQHVVVGPHDLGAEYTWGWQGYFWGREPRLEQFDLEIWSGASARATLPDATNRYVFSALGAPGELRLRVAPRWSIVLLASGAALVAGLGLVYWPALRRPGVLWGAATAVLAVAFIYPEPTLLVLQAASLGALLALLAWGLKTSLSRKPRQRAGSTLIRPGSSIARRESDAFVRPPALAGSNSSTETGPLAGQLSAPDPNL
ncbi:MAG: hypothetical protein JNG90_16575 [Planctomycetaceae bacterium]|nr:hypothetical protein [Planctomycetaceae bacterium]